MSRGLALLGAALMTLVAGPAGAASHAREPTLSGYWQQQPPFLPEVMLPAPAPFTPPAAAQMRSAAAKVAAGAAIEYCRPYKFSGYSWGVAAELEILTTPARITMISDDIGLVRRIYFGPAPSAADIIATNSGISTGRWEGGTLVVETTGLDPAASFPLPLPGAPSLGRNAKVTERIHLQGKDLLVFEVETSAPDILTAPDRRRWVYRRVAKQFDYATPMCVDFDRSIDQTSGRQRFDLTTPSDLPPPPRG